MSSMTRKAKISYNDWAKADSSIKEEEVVGFLDNQFLNPFVLDAESGIKGFRCLSYHIDGHFSVHLADDEGKAVRCTASGLEGCFGTVPGEDDDERDQPFWVRGVYSSALNPVGKTLGKTLALLAKKHLAELDEWSRDVEIGTAIQAVPIFKAFIEEVLWARYQAAPVFFDTLQAKAEATQARLAAQAKVKEVILTLPDPDLEREAQSLQQKLSAVGGVRADTVARAGKMAKGDFPHGDNELMDWLIKAEDLLAEAQAEAEKDASRVERRLAASQAAREKEEAEAQARQATRNESADDHGDMPLYPSSDEWQAHRRGPRADKEETNSAFGDLFAQTLKGKK